MPKYTPFNILLYIITSTFDKTNNKKNSLKYEFQDKTTKLEFNHTFNFYRQVSIIIYKTTDMM